MSEGPNRHERIEPGAAGVAPTCVHFLARRASMICFFMLSLTLLCLRFSWSSSSTLVLRCVWCCLLAPAPNFNPEATCEKATRRGHHGHLLRGRARAPGPGHVPDTTHPRPCCPRRLRVDATPATPTTAATRLLLEHHRLPILPRNVSSNRHRFSPPTQAHGARPEERQRRRGDLWTRCSSGDVILRLAERPSTWGSPACPRRALPAIGALGHATKERSQPHEDILVPP